MDEQEASPYFAAKKTVIIGRYTRMFKIKIKYVKLQTV